MAHRPGDSWVMSNEARGASSLTIGASGISVSALSSMAARAGATAVMLLAPGREAATLGAGLEPGLGDFERADKVTYVTGPGQDLAELMAQQLMVPGRSVAEAAANAPRAVRFTGDIPPDEWLRDERGGAAPDDAEEDGYWKAVRRLDTAAAYEAYLEDYPEGRYRTLARNALVQRPGEDDSGYTSIPQEEPESEADRAKRLEAELGLNRAARRQIQRNLTVLGYDTRGIDGIFGRGTRRAIARWQRDNDLQANGHLRRGQITRLENQARQRNRELEAEAEARRAEERERDRAYWRATGEGRDEAGLRAYLDEFPEGEYSGLAEERLDAIEEDYRRGEGFHEGEAWDEARHVDTRDAYQAFLREYPDGRFADQARARLNELRQQDELAKATEKARKEERSVAGTGLVRNLVERRLEKRGYRPGKVDGKFTKTTRRAIRAFQRDQNLVPTGYVTRRTLARLIGG